MNIQSSVRHSALLCRPAAVGPVTVAILMRNAVTAALVHVGPAE